MIEALVFSELVAHPIRLLNEVLPIYELRFYQRNNFSANFVVRGFMDNNKSCDQLDMDNL